ncbi:hypothetical protein JD844_026735 [Phrynosoma platyrhinos]|uniref:Alpha-1,3-mannosyl-glycoprotein 4-beta-N-acetylglucosaminyltransferase B n=1 Tax=Phrynosoma platyrhinos TaxID=52577 RepID=A0ABQ7SFA0_PHRPL|nr:hypothetical protein JD844_026735 [Phrynosoma platyrhinos]
MTDFPPYSRDPKGCVHILLQSRSSKDLYERHLLELRQRLLYAEKENKKRSHELHGILNEMKRVIGELTENSVNVTASEKWKAFNLSNQFPLHLTNIHYYLPHLQEQVERIHPNNLLLIFRWRTKQNLDYSFLMLYAQPKGRFYLQLEDDIIAKPEYIQIINDFIKQQESREWMILEFSQLGFIGKLFRCRDLPLIVDFFLMFYKDKPIDWLLDHLLGVKVCNPEKDAKHCERQKDYLRIRYKPSLFQHVGIHSSLAGKIQYLKDRDFFKNSLFKAHANPPAKVTTSLKVFQHFTLEKAYRGVECFWAFAPVAGDYILFSFQQPLEIKSYLFRSGNQEHPGDKLRNATVDVLPDGSAGGNLQDLQNVKTSDGYFQIGAFENGIANGIISPVLGRIQALRLSIHSSSSMWVLLSEIFLKT